MIVKPWVAFDIEICDQLNTALPLEDQLPLGISCAAVVSCEGKATTYCGQEGLDGKYTVSMAPQDLQLMLWELWEWHQKGYDIVAWNGAGFDWRVLHAAVQGEDERHACIRMAKTGIDPAFQILCVKGFMVGLAKACSGMGLPGKMAGMSGKQAPLMWRRSREDQDKVLAYVLQDVVATGALYNAMVTDVTFHWVSNSGKSNFLQLLKICEANRARLMTVTEAQEIEVPDTSWMSDSSKWDRERFVGWLNAEFPLAIRSRLDKVMAGPVPQAITSLQLGIDALQEGTTEGAITLLKELVEITSRLQGLETRFK